MNIVIEYEGDDITDNVVFSQTTFLSRTDGNPGECYIRVRDKNHIYAVASADSPSYFHTGGILRLLIDDVLEWRGWVMAASMSYAFDVDDTSTPSQTPRFWTLNGLDLNVLFQRRYVYRKTDPADSAGLPYYDGGTLDREVILDFLENYVDLSDTPLELDGGVPVGDLIDEIGTPGDEEFRIASVGAPFVTLFADIVGQTGGVFYITPDGYIVYADSESVTADHVLTDQPTGDDVGYREMTITSKGEALGNDALVWGAGKGSSDPVFARVQDEESIELHGRMQWGDQYAGAWKQSTVQRRANTFVNGSPLNHRGHKDDQDFISVVVFEQGYRPAQVVDFRCETFSYSDVVPIRTVRISFPTPTDAKWELELSHQIDVPFGRTDLWDDPSDPPPDGCAGDDDIPEATLDDFNRTDSSWGTSSGGFLWDGVGDNEVDGAEGVGYSYVGGEDASGPAWMALFLEGVVNRSITMRYRFDDETVPYMTNAFVAMSMFNVYDPVGDTQPTSFNMLRVHWYWNGMEPLTESYPDDLHIEEADFDDRNSWRIAKFDWFEGTMRVKSWLDGSAEPAWHELPFDIEPDFSLEGILLSWYIPPPADSSFRVDWIITGVSEFCTSGRSDIEDAPELDDGIYHTRYPYIAGTLRVFIDGVEIFEFTETDPENNEFTIQAEVTGDVTCRYTPYREDDTSTSDGDWQWPVQGYISQEFGCTGFYLEPPYGDCDHFHDGIDIVAADMTKLYAPHDGYVGYLGPSTTGSYMIRIDTTDGYSTRLGHMHPINVVQPGQFVNKGDHVGYMGNTGNSTGVHTHWEVYDGDTPVNPRSLL